MVPSSTHTDVFLRTFLEVANIFVIPSGHSLKTEYEDNEHNSHIVSKNDNWNLKTQVGGSSWRCQVKVFQANILVMGKTIFYGLIMELIILSKASDISVLQFTHETLVFIWMVIFTPSPSDLYAITIKRTNIDFTSPKRKKYAQRKIWEILSYGE